MSSSLRNSLLKKIQAIIHPRCHVSLRFRFCNCFPFTFTLLSVSVHHCLLIVKWFALFTWPSLTKKRQKSKQYQTKPRLSNPKFVHYWRTLLTAPRGWRQRGVPLGACSMFLKDSAKQGEKLERWKEMVTSELWLISQLLFFLDNSNQLSIS